MAYSPVNNGDSGLQARNKINGIGTLLDSTIADVADKATIASVDLKIDKNVDIVAATHTKITYDVRGLVTSGADATTADFADSTDKRFVTDAELANIVALSSTYLPLSSISLVQATDLTDGGDSTLHYHATDRARANHTGTQLASTISDFAATVRASVLTGLSLATNAVILSTDTILVALGKLQAKLTDVETKLPYLSSGVYGAGPSFADNGDGSATIGGCDCLLYSTTDFTNGINKYTIPSTTIIFTDGAEEYVVVDYNAGNPIFRKETVEDNINGSNIVEIYVVWRQATTLHSLGFDGNGTGLSNKLDLAEYHTDRYQIDAGGGLVISESTSPANRTVLVSAARVYTGSMRQDVLGFNSSTDLLTMTYHVGSVWNYANQTVYNNTQFDDGTNLVALTGSQWTVAWFYRSIGDVKQVFYVMGTNHWQNQAAAEAGETPRTDLPSLLKDHCVLVGRASIQRNATSGSMASAFGTFFQGATVINHNDTNNIQGGNPTNGEYYHLTANQFNSLRSIVTKTTTYLATTADRTILCDATTGAFTINLMPAANFIGYPINVKKIDSSQNAITVDANSTELIDGFQVKIISGQYDSMTIISNGTFWSII